MPDPHYRRAFQRALVGHALLLALLALAILPSRCRRQAPPDLPIEFLVEMPSVAPADPVPATVPPPEPEPEPEPEPAPEPAPRPRPQIEVSRERVRRTLPAPEKPTLTPEEIRRLIEEGARPADRTVTPDEQTRGRARVREVLYAAWQQPSRAEGGTRPVRAQIDLDAAGRLSGFRIVESSGSAVMDETVRQALASVGRITGLTPAFLQQNPRLQVEFRLQ